MKIPKCNQFLFWLVMILLSMIFTLAFQERDPVRNTEISSYLKSSGKIVQDLGDEIKQTHKNKQEVNLGNVKNKDSTNRRNRQFILKNKEKKKSKSFSRPEHQGEDFSNLKDDSLIKLLKTGNKIEIRKASIVLGNRNIAGSLALSSSQLVELNNILTETILVGINSSKGSTREETKHNIERIWRLAVPALISLIGRSEPKIKNLVERELVLMRNEETVSKLINKYAEVKSKEEKEFIVFILKKMKNFSHSRIQGRDCISDEESEILYKTLIIPFFDSLNINTVAI